MKMSWCMAIGRSSFCLHWDQGFWSFQHRLNQNAPAFRFLLDEGDFSLFFCFMRHSLGAPMPLDDSLTPLPSGSRRFFYFLPESLSLTRLRRAEDIQQDSLSFLIRTLEVRRNSLTRICVAGSSGLNISRERWRRFKNWRIQEHFLSSMSYRYTDVKHAKYNTSW